MPVFVMFAMSIKCESHLEGHSLFSCSRPLKGAGRTDIVCCLTVCVPQAGTWRRLVLWNVVCKHSHLLCLIQMFFQTEAHRWSVWETCMETVIIWAFELLFQLVLLVTQKLHTPSLLLKYSNGKLRVCLHHPSGLIEFPNEHEQMGSSYPNEFDSNSCSWNVCSSAS